VSEPLAEADVLVVGGGIAGASVAYELATSASVVLAEAEATLAHHTTGRSAAVFTENYGNPIVRALTIASRPFLQDPPDGFSEVPLLSPRGALCIGRADQLERLDAFALEGRRLVPSIERLDPPDALTHCPVLDADYVAGAVWEPDACDIDVHAVLTGYVRGFRHRGGHIVTHARVTGARRRSGRWEIRTTAGQIHTGWVVDAAGAWADLVAAGFDAAPIGLHPLRRTAFLFDPPSEEDPRKWPLVIDIDEDFYFKPEGNRLLGSPADETPSGPCDARPAEIDVALALDRIGAALGTELRHAHQPWAGLRTFAPDRTPVVGPDPTVENFCWLAGQGGYGIQTSPAMAAAAAALVLNDELPEPLLAAGITRETLGPGRFRSSAD